MKLINGLTRQKVEGKRKNTGWGEKIEKVN